MLRKYATSLILIAAIATPAAAQGVETAVIVGYGALSIGAISSLASRNKPPQVEPGTTLKVRLRGSSNWSSSAMLVRVTNDSIVVASDSGASAFARSAIDSIQVKASTGRWAEGWLIGLIAGGATGALLAYESTAASGGDDWFTPNQAAVVGGVFLGATASIVGAGIGLLAPSRWVTIGDLRDARVSIAPTLARPGFVARIQF